jgi:hypothetical protein
VMHYGEMPRATLGSSDLRSQVAIFGERNIYGTRWGDITLYVRNKLQICMCNDNIKVGEITLYVEV